MKHKGSFYSYLACAALMLFATFFFYPKWNRSAGEAVLGWDVSCYYWYLPSAIIYKDLKQQKFGDSIVSKYWFTGSFEQSYVHESGNRVITYSSGMAFMYLPLFLTAHVLAEPLGYVADGFSTPYQFALQVGSLLAALLALWYFRKLFLMFFEDRTVAILLLLLVFGTNYLNYAAIDGALTHNWLFLLYVFLLLNTVYFYRTPGYKYAIRIGLLCGLMTLIRPSEMICVLLPLLWGMEGISLKAIKDKLAFLKTHLKELAVAVICMIAVGSVQILYWLYVTGKPLVYSYQEKGFSWMHPHFRDYIFSYRSGWVTYTPLIILCFIGIPFFIKYGKNKIAVLSFFALNLYIVSAWDIWWYGGTGGRAMIQSYPVILFPMAALIQYIYNRRILGWVLSPVIILLAYFNLWFTYNAHAGEGLYDPNGMTHAYYWNVIYRYHVDAETKKLKDTDELFRGEPKNKKLLYTYDFESDTSAATASNPPITGKRSGGITPAVQDLRILGFHYAGDNNKWVRAQATFRCVTQEWDDWRIPQFIVRFSKGDSVVKDRMIRTERFVKEKETKDVFIDIKIPEQSFDSVHVMLWTPGSEKTLLVDDVRVWSFHE